MIIALSVVAALGGLGVIATMCLKTASPDAGFGAALGGGGDAGSHRKGGTDELLEKLLKVSAVVWLTACFLIALLSAHLPATSGFGG